MVLITAMINAIIAGIRVHKELKAKAIPASGGIFPA
jgi:hypothetical protein